MPSNANKIWLCRNVKHEKSCIHSGYQLALSLSNWFQMPPQLTFARPGPRPRLASQVLELWRHIPGHVPSKSADGKLCVSSHLSQFSCFLLWVSTFYTIKLVFMDVQTLYWFSSRSRSHKVMLDRDSFRGIFNTKLVIIYHEISYFSAFEL